MHYFLASSIHLIYNITKTLYKSISHLPAKRRNKTMIEHTLYKESNLDKLKKKFSRIGSRMEDIFLSAALWLADILHSNRLNNRLKIWYVSICTTSLLFQVREVSRLLREMIIPQTTDCFKKFLHDFPVCNFPMPVSLCYYD